MNEHKTEEIAVLEKPLFFFDPSYMDAMTVRDMSDNVFVAGIRGSGKSTGSGALIAKSLLESGCGGIILTAKNEERHLFEHYAEQTDRTDDLVILEPDGEHCFNFLDYEAEHSGQGGEYVGNVVDVIKTVVRSSDMKKEYAQGEAFWDESLNGTLHSTIDLLFLADGRLQIDALEELVASLPTSKEQLNDEEWRNNSLFYEKMRLALHKRDEGALTDKEVRRLEKIDSYFLNTYMDLADETRTSITMSYISLLQSLTRDPIYSMLCAPETTFTPEDCFNEDSAKIIIIDLPILKYQKAGSDAQTLLKHVFQKAMLRREIKENSPLVFIYADEAQFTMTEFDIDFNSVSRSYRVASIYITQNLPNFYLHAGAGDKGKTRVDALIGNFATKIFHANTCEVTNKYASTLIGQDLQEMGSHGGSSGKEVTTNWGNQEGYHAIIRPEAFTKLKNGGPQNDFIIEAIVHRTKPFKSMKGENYIKAEFDQDLSQSSIQSQENTSEQIVDTEQHNYESAKEFEEMTDRYWENENSKEDLAHVKKLYRTMFQGRRNFLRNIWGALIETFSHNLVLIPEVFLRRRFGERYLNWGYITTVFLLLVTPFFFRLAYIGFGNSVAKVIPSDLSFLVASLDWFLGLFNWFWVVFAGLFLWRSILHMREIRTDGSTFDFKRFSLSDGESWSFWWKFKNFEEIPVTPKTVSIIFEPLVVVIIGLLLADFSFGAGVGRLLILCGVLLAFSREHRAYKARQKMLAIIDDIIISESRKEAILLKRPKRETRGFQVTHLPDDPHLRRKIYDRLNKIIPKVNRHQRAST